MRARSNNVNADVILIDTNLDYNNNNRSTPDNMIFSLVLDKARQRASVKWILSKAYNNRVPDDLREPFYRDHEGQDHLKPKVSPTITPFSIHMSHSSLMLCRFSLEPRGIPRKDKIKTVCLWRVVSFSDCGWIGKCIDILPNISKSLLRSKLPKLEPSVHTTDIGAQGRARRRESRYAVNWDCPYSNQSITHCKCLNFFGFFVVVWRNVARLKLCEYSGCTRPKCDATPLCPLLNGVANIIS